MTEEERDFAALDAANEQDLADLTRSRVAVLERPSGTTYAAPRRRVVAVEDELVYCDDGTLWTRRAGGDWYQPYPPIPGTPAARERR